ncbi:hypothetical protein [Dyella caseinilytica]|uniref:Uncharacterized protein n=1 Tax=Dyella caseinilytica TaxID=1849581 RepID=A0ABX7GPK6_9GAMM|nr:hypothetical protein [Dyella caseinilytica]QRN52244.1 hypothetical protein ISN74_12165 [Dyella caseinilytica]GGA14289.1 hypothetical protein GCM10011408_40070 [Dyella caseinilytica]
MAFGSIVIDLDPTRTDSDICDDLLEHDVVIVEIGTRPTKSHRRNTISEALKQRSERWGKEEDEDVILQTLVVNSQGCICTYDTIDDLDNYDEFDVLHLSGDGVIGMSGVDAGIQQLTMAWRKKGKPNRYVLGFDYADDEDDEEEGERD